MPLWEDPLLTFRVAVGIPLYGARMVRNVGVCSLTVVFVVWLSGSCQCLVVWLSGLAGSVYSWGSCKSGQLGNGHKVSIPVPKIVLQGTSGSDRPLGPNSVVKLCCGTAHTAALTSECKICCESDPLAMLSGV